MKQQIIESINDPAQLEELYRRDPKDFEKCFSEISGELDTPLARFWSIRLAADRTSAKTGFRLRDLVEVLAIALLTALVVLIPALFKDFNREFFYMRDVALIAFTGLIAYSFRLNPVSGFKKIIWFGILIFITGLYINLLPTDAKDSVLIAGLHIPLMLWCFFGFTYVRFDYRSLPGRIDFIRFTGELVIMAGLILLAGGVLTGITMGLFDVIGMDIEKFYFDFIAIPGGAAAPVVAYYLIRTYPGITSKIAPVIARIFTPVVLVTLVVYLVSLLFSTNSILGNRELLVIFNVMLLGVLALILFSVSGINRATSSKNTLLALFLLSVVAIVINSVALVAIISRITDGLTPNRTVVLATNILVFINLILIAVSLFRSCFRGDPVDRVERSVARYLPVYAAWTVIAIFILPVVFGFR